MILSGEGFGLIFWWASHLFIWGVLSLLWSLSYFGIELLNILYLLMWQVLGLWGGFFMIVFGIALFLIIGGG